MAREECKALHLVALQDERGGFRFDSADTWSAKFEAFGAITSPDGSKCMDSHHLDGVKSTGTTIVGVLTNEGVVMAADARSTMGAVVADPACRKLHSLGDNMFAAGAGVAGDLNNQMHLFDCLMRLQKLRSNRQPRVISMIRQLSTKLFRYGGHIRVALIVGGVDCDGAHLWYVSGAGYYAQGPYLCMGSGGQAAGSYLAAAWQPGLTLEEGKAMAARAVRQGVLNDPYSGSYVDVCSVDLAGRATLFSKFEDYAQDLRALAPDPAVAQGETEVLVANETVRAEDGNYGKDVSVEDSLEMRD